LCEFRVAPTPRRIKQPFRSCYEQIRGDPGSPSDYQKYRTNGKSPQFPGIEERAESQRKSKEGARILWRQETLQLSDWRDAIAEGMEKRRQMFLLLARFEASTSKKGQV